MGYNITIGEAVLESEWPTDHDAPSAWWSAKGTTHPEAPHSSDSKQSNGRDPGYGIWSDFCRTTGLREWMFGEDEGKMRQHPGCFSLTAADVAIVSAALAKYRETHPKAEATFCQCVECVAPWRAEEKLDWPAHNENADGNMVRLVWLEWWVRWAVTNCERPCISNT